MNKMDKTTVAQFVLMNYVMTYVHSLDTVHSTSHILVVDQMGHTKNLIGDNGETVGYKLTNEEPVEVSHVICNNGTCKNEMRYVVNTPVTPNGIILIKESKHNHKDREQKGVTLHPTVIGVSTVVFMYVVFLALYYLFYTRKKQKLALNYELGHINPQAADVTESELDSPGDYGSVGVIGGRAGKNLWVGSPNINTKDSIDIKTKCVTSEQSASPLGVTPKSSASDKEVIRPHIFIPPRVKSNAKKAVMGHYLDGKRKDLVCPVIYIEDDYQIVPTEISGVRNKVYTSNKVNSNTSTKTRKKGTHMGPMDFLSVPRDTEEGSSSGGGPIKRKLSYTRACCDSDDDENLHLLPETIQMKYPPTEGAQSNNSHFLTLHNPESPVDLSAGLINSAATGDFSLVPPALHMARRPSYREACDSDSEGGTESWPSTPVTEKVIPDLLSTTCMGDGDNIQTSQGDNNGDICIDLVPSYNPGNVHLDEGKLAQLYNPCNVHLDQGNTTQLYNPGNVHIVEGNTAELYDKQLLCNSSGLLSSSTGLLCNSTGLLHTPGTYETSLIPPRGNTSPLLNRLGDNGMHMQTSTSLLTPTSEYVDTSLNSFNDITHGEGYNFTSVPVSLDVLSVITPPGDHVRKLSYYKACVDGDIV